MKTETKKILIGFLVAYFIIGLLCFAIGRWCYVKPIEPITQDTIKIEWCDTVYEHIAVHDTVPTQIAHTVIKTDTVYTKDGDELPLETALTTWSDTIANDNDTVSYLAYIKGINSSLDSIDINVNRREITKTIEITKYIEKKNKKKFKDYVRFVPSAGVGYGIMSKKPDVYVGFGISVDLYK